MKRIVVPTTSAEDWKRGLADPELHWKPGYSAMTLARSWEAAHPHVPTEISEALATAGTPLLSYVDLVLAIPEYQVDLPGGRRPSQTDVLALLGGSAGLVAMAVEGKVDEAFGPTVGQKRAERSAGVNERLAWLADRLGLTSVPDSVRYQLLHRTASALVAAEQFHATAAVMVIQSFSPTCRWFEDYQAFAELMGVEAAVGSIARTKTVAGLPLFIGWCQGDQKFRERA